MKKLLFLSESLSGGGAEKVLVTLLKNLDQTKFEITMCCVVDSGPYVEEVNFTFVISVFYLTLPICVSLSLYIHINLCINVFTNGYLFGWSTKYSKI